MGTRSIKCPSCGADIPYGSKDKKAQCACCGGTYRVREGRLTKNELPPPTDSDWARYRRRLRRWRLSILTFSVISAAVFGFGEAMELKYGGYSRNMAWTAGLLLLFLSPIVYMQTKPLPPADRYPVVSQAGRFMSTALLFLMNAVLMTAASMTAHYLCE